jgi:hypothetical protein
MTRWIFWVVLVGCTGNKEDMSGPSCEDTPTVVGLDDLSPLEFSPQALVDLAVGVSDESFVWVRDDSVTGVTVSIAHVGGEARFVESVAVYPDGDEPQPGIGIICDDRVELDVSVQFTTEDGAFDETFATVLAATVVEQAEWGHDLDPDALGGTYDMDVDIDIDETEWDERRLRIHGVSNAEGSTGEVSGQVIGEEECDGDQCTAWAMDVEVGTWGKAAE